MHLVLKKATMLPLLLFLHLAGTHDNAFLSTNPLLIDFGKENTGMDWLIINDGVMGGLSQGSAYLAEEYIQFEGTISLENNGGFSSLRSRFQAMDLSAFDKVEIKYQLEGQPFAFVMETDQRWYMPNFKKQIPATDGEWATVEIDLFEMQAYRIGRPQNRYLNKENLEEIIRVGFISDGKKAGDFKMLVDYIKFIPKAEN